MSAPEPVTDRSPVTDSAADPRPGPLAWVVIVCGWVVMAVAVLGAVGDERLGGIGSWVTWVVGAAVLHDAVVLPLVLVAGWLVTRLVPTPWRVPLQVGLVVAAIVTLAVWPIAQRWGAREDNPSILPLPVARNLAWVVAVVLLVALGVGAVQAVRRRSAGPAPRHSPGAADGEEHR